MCLCDCVRVIMCDCGIVCVCVLLKVRPPQTYVCIACQWAVAVAILGFHERCLVA